jgi:hypothetical protein
MVKLKKDKLNNIEEFILLITSTLADCLAEVLDIGNLMI